MPINNSTESKNERTRVRLTPYNNALVGKYSHECKHVHVVLESDNAGFSVLLPDGGSAQDQEFIVYNIGNNDVTVNAPVGQTMSTGETSHIISHDDTVTFVYDMRGTWLLSDVNKGAITNRVTSTTYTITATDEVLFVDTDSNSVVIAMPKGTSGRHIKICNTGSSGNNITLTQYGSEAIYGATSETIYNGEVFDLHFDSIEGWW